MKKILILFFLCCCFHSHAQTPDLVWGRNGISFNTGQGISVGTDNSDNVFVTGAYSGSLTFGSFVLSSPSGAFLAKYDANGNIKWAKSSLGSAAVAYWVTADNFGNSYITGSFSVSASFGATLLSSSGLQDFFLVKYDSAGNVMWAKSGGGTAVDAGHGVATDVSGNIYVTGFFESSSFTIGSFTLTGTATTSSFLAKYDSSGNVVWAKNTTGAGTGSGYNVAADSSGNVFQTGVFGPGTATFGSYTITSAGINDIFLAKYDSSGNALWVKRAGGSNSDIGYSVSTDAVGNAYVTGNFGSSSVTFGTTTLTNAGAADAFLVKYSPAGNVLWAKSIHGTSQETGYSVAVDKNAKIYLSGNFSSPSLTLDTIILTPVSGSIDPLFLASYDSSGHVLFAKALPSGGDDNNGLAVGPTGCVYVGGDFRGSTMIVDNDTLYSPTGQDNVFVIKLCENGSGQNVPNLTDNNPLRSFPNPFHNNLNLTTENNTITEATIFDITSRPLLRQKFTSSVSLNAESLASGIYILQLRDEKDGCYTAKVIKD